MLVTGARGFLGSHVCSRLVREGAEVYGVSRVARDISAPGIHWLEADLADIDSVRAVFARARPDLVYHFAGHVSATPALDAVRLTLDSLLISAVNLLIAATEQGASRVILPGSLVEPADGDAELSPTSPYVAAKWAASAYARMFHFLYKTPVVIVRLAYIYGPGQPEGRLISYVIRSLLAQQAPRLSSGQFEADWTYIDDAVDGLIAVARSPEIDGRTIDIGTGAITSARDVVLLAVELFGKDVALEFGAVPDRPSDRTRGADVEGTRRVLGWSPSIDLREGLRRTIDSLTESHPG